MRALNLVLLTALALLSSAAPGAAQSHTFGYAAGFAPVGERGLQLSAALERIPEPGRLGRRYELLVSDQEGRDLFLLASLVYRHGVRPVTPYALLGAGVYTGADLPLSATAGVGVESSRHFSAPVFAEARLLYAGSFVLDLDNIGAANQKELIPSITLGVRLAPAW